MARNPAGDDNLAGNTFTDSDGDVHLNGTTVFAEAATIDFAEGKITNVICSGTVAVTIPTIADAETDTVAVDVASAFTASIAVGDFVVAAPLEALPTSCLYAGCYVSATDTISLTFTTLEGGAGVTGAAKNFKFLVIKAAASS